MASLPNYAPKTMAPTEPIQKQIDQLSHELSTLRLPHKLNQYRIYEKSLRSLRESISNEPKLDKLLDQLQAKLDQSVICGVTECFLCGPESNNQPSSTVQPAYLRSISASSATRTKSGLTNSYAKQTSLVEKPLGQYPKIQPIQPHPPASTFHSKPVDEKLNTVPNNEAETCIKSNQSAAENSTPSVPSIAVNSTVSVTNATHAETLATSGCTSNVTANDIKASSKPTVAAKSPTISPSKGPLNSYRAYKDFINNYSSIKSNASTGSNSTP